MTTSPTLAQDSAAAARRSDDSYVGRRGAVAEVAAKAAPSVHGDLKVLRSLAAKQNATRRMGQNRRSHGRSQNW